MFQPELRENKILATSLIASSFFSLFFLFRSFSLSLFLSFILFFSVFELELRENCTLHLCVDSKFGFEANFCNLSLLCSSKIACVVYNLNTHLPLNGRHSQNSKFKMLFYSKFGFAVNFSNIFSFPLSLALAKLHGRLCPNKCPGKVPKI